MMRSYVFIFVLCSFVFTPLSLSQAATSEDIASLWTVIQSLQRDVAQKKNTLTATVAQTTLPADVDPQASTASNCITLTRDIRYRSTDSTTGGEVSLLQDFLNTEGLFNQESTGYAGLVTIKAVRDFQTKYAIRPTGFVGPLSRAKIREVSCGTVTSSTVVPAMDTGAVRESLRPSLPNTNTNTSTNTPTTPVSTPNVTGEMTLSMIYPSTANPGVSLFLYGENFPTEGMTVYLDDKPFTPKIITSTVAMIRIPDNLVNGNFNFTVTAARNGIKTKGYPLTVIASEATQTIITPVISSISPSVGALGSSLTLFGRGLLNTSVVEIYNKGVLVGKTERFFTASNGGAVTFTLADFLFTTIPTPGSSLEIGVMSDAIRSNRINFTLATATSTTTPPVSVVRDPIISSVTPNPATAGVTMYIYGENFEKNSVVEVNASPAGGSILSSTVASLTLPATMTSGTYTVTIRNGSIKSNGMQFVVNTPTQNTPVITTTSTNTSVTPAVTTSVTNTQTTAQTTPKTPSISVVTPNPANPGVALYVYGDNFDSGSVIELNGVTYPTTVLSQYVAFIRIPDTTTVGSYIVTIRNGSIKSNTIPLTISR